MKFISKQVINATKTRTRVQREVEYMRTLRHAHIIKLYVREPPNCPMLLTRPTATGMR
jgi:serine/threonine protein kinase